MRDIAVTLLFILGCYYTLKRPYVGILVWSWLGFMNPHRLCYGFAYSLPLSYIIAVLTLLAYAVSDERKALPKDKLVVLMIAFLLWMSVSTLFAMNTLDAGDYYIGILKKFFPILLSMALFNTQERIHQLLWVMIISIGFFGVKGGIFTVVSGGSFHVFGPPESVLEENNALAVAELMVIPLMLYMRGQLTRHWQQQLMLFCVVAMAFSAIGSQSRGAFLAMSGLGGYFWLQSKRKLPVTLGIIILVALLYQFLPESWYQRMDTIKTYDQDESAMGRIRAWTFAYNVANDRLFGGGYQLWTRFAYREYLPGYTDEMPAYVAHSIYFHVLGEHGWVGLLMFLSVFFLAWRYCSQITKQTKGDPEKKWQGNLAAMIKLSLLCYLTGGAFLSLSYLDLTWQLVALVVVLKEMAVPVVKIPGLIDRKLNPDLEIQIKKAKPRRLWHNPE